MLSGDIFQNKKSLIVWLIIQTNILFPKQVINKVKIYLIKKELITWFNMVLTSFKL